MTGDAPTGADARPGEVARHAAEASRDADDVSAGSVSFRAALGVFVRIALQSFGGPAGQIAVMHRLVVEERRWLSEARFLHALNYCMLLPGPEAQQLATYVGWLLHGVRGGVAAGVLFVLPGMLSILALSVMYVLWGDVGVVAGIFAGLKPAVLAIVVDALLRLSKRALRGRILPLFAATAFVALFVFGLPFPLVVVGAAAGGALLRRHVLVARADGPASLGRSLADRGRPGWSGAVTTLATCAALWALPLVVVASTLGVDSTLFTLGAFFSQVAVVTFGGAYAVLAFVAQQAVDVHHWLLPGEMLDGLGLAETTPGPLIMVVQFVGFVGAYRHPDGMEPVLAGVLGALLTTWVTFVPCFLWIFLGAPFVERLRGVRALDAALTGITAAVVGVILNLSLWFALHVLFGEVRTERYGVASVSVPDWTSLRWRSAWIAAGALLATLRWRVGMLPLLGACAAIGVLTTLFA